jgi:bifunctional non-homologous end joining protein LigD
VVSSRYWTSFNFPNPHEPMITPMVARLVREPFDRAGWFFELKWDGFWAIAGRDHGGQEVRSSFKNQI